MVLSHHYPPDRASLLARVLLVKKQEQDTERVQGL